MDLPDVVVLSLLPGVSRRRLGEILRHGASATSGGVASAAGPAAPLRARRFPAGAARRGVAPRAARGARSGPRGGRSGAGTRGAVRHRAADPGHTGLSVRARDYRRPAGRALEPLGVSAGGCGGRWTGGADRSGRCDCRCARGHGVRLRRGRAAGNRAGRSRHHRGQRPGPGRRCGRAPRRPGERRRLVHGRRPGVWRGRDVPARARRARGGRRRARRAGQRVPAGHPAASRPFSPAQPGHQRTLAAPWSWWKPRPGAARSSRPTARSIRDARCWPSPATCWGGATAAATRSCGTGQRSWRMWTISWKN